MLVVLYVQMKVFAACGAACSCHSVTSQRAWCVSAVAAGASSSGGRVTSGGEQLSPRAECALHHQVIFLPLNIFKIITESPPVETSFLLLGTFLWKRACRCWRFHFSPSVFEGAALLLAAGCRPIGDGKWYLVPNPDQSLFHSRPPPLPFCSLCCVPCVWWRCYWQM